MEIDYKAALQYLVDTILEGESGGEIDAGCNGDGPLANAMVALGMYPDVEEATDAIYPDFDWDAE